MTRRHILDPVVVCVVVCGLEARGNMQVLFASRGVALVRVERGRGPWFLVCSNPSSLCVSLLQETLDPAVCVFLFSFSRFSFLLLFFSFSSFSFLCSSACLFSCMCLL